MKRTISALASAAFMSALAFSTGAAADPHYGMRGRDVPAWTESFQERSPNRVRIDQIGARNGAGIAQRGQSNDVGVTQNGSDNIGIVRQNGDNNTLGVYQRGNNNTATVTQNGDDNLLCVLQVGNGNNADIVQSGGQAQAIIQTPVWQREIDLSRFQHRYGGPAFRRIGGPCFSHG